MDNIPQPRIPNKAPIMHYHGDRVRSLFLTGALIMFLYIPFENDLLPTTVLTLVILAMAVVLFAGFTNPRQRSIIIFDTLIAAVLCFIFESFAVQTYAATHSLFDMTFLVRQVLAVCFLLAFYFSSKTVRGLTIPS